MVSYLGILSVLTVDFIYHIFFSVAGGTMVSWRSVECLCNHQEAFALAPDRGNSMRCSKSYCHSRQKHT